ncbi:MAG: hypothetical protein LBI61_01215 [Puniceicoccales bacterium]|nr:hypothetical protein [Puniceicoccales bacterium]
MFSISKKLKSSVVKAFDGGVGQRLIRHIGSSDKRCFIVPSGYPWKNGDPGSASDIFLRLLPSYMVNYGTISQELEKQIGQLFPAKVEPISLPPVDVPEYAMEVTHGEASESLAVRVVQQFADTRKVILHTVLSPFMAQSGNSLAAAMVSTNALACARELIRKVAENNFDTKQSSAVPLAASFPKESDISMGYCVTIPDIGDVLISHGGDVVLDGIKTISPLHIANPSSAVIKDVDIGKLTIESSSMVLIDQHKTINSLEFQSNDGNVAGVYVDNGSDLAIGELSLANALLVNSGKIFLNGTNALNGISILNAGEMGTVHTLSGISHLWNCSSGIIRSLNNLVISGASISNMGNIIAPQINIISECLLSNFGTIRPSQEVNIYGDGDMHNHGIIGENCANAYVTGTRFRQYGDGKLNGSSVSINSRVAELSGKLRVQKVSFGGTTALLDSVRMDDVEEMTLSTSDDFLAGTQARFGKIGKLINEGTATFRADLNDVGQLHNTSTGKLRLLNHASVTGADGILNDGHIFVHGGKEADENNLLIIGKESHSNTVNIKKAYVGTKDAILEYGNGATVAAGTYNNGGASFSHSRLTIGEHGGKNSYGHVAARNTIEYHVHGAIPNFGGHVITPCIDESEKRFIVLADKDITVTTPFNGAVRLEMHAPKGIANRSTVTALSIGAKSHSLVNGKDVPSGPVVNYGTLSSSGKIEVLSKSFLNDGGRVESRGDITFNVADGVKNTGGGRLEKDVEEEITVFEPVAVPLKPNAGSGKYERVKLKERKIKVKRDIYHPNLEKAGVITTGGGRIKVTAGIVDNSFGVLNAHGGIDLSSRGEIVNESGLIRSGGDTSINGKQLRNGYRKASQIYDSANPSRPIRTEQTITGRWHMVPERRSEWVFDNDLCRIFNHGHRRYYTASVKKKLPNIKEFVTTGYESMPQASTASAYPGYIFSTGNIVVNTGLAAYLGTIVSESNIRLGGESIGNISFKDRGTVIAYGDVDAEMERAATDQVAIQAKNISIKVIEDFIVNGVIRPTVLPDGTIIHMFDIRKFAHAIGMLTDGSRDTLQSVLSAKDENTQLMAMRSADTCGFTDERPEERLIASTVPDSTCRTVVNLALAPIYGRETLVQKDLVTALERAGEERSRGDSSSSNPVILYSRSDQEDVNAIVDGESTLIPLYNPMLLFDAASKIANIIAASEKTSINSLGNIRIDPGEINVNTRDIDLMANGKISALSQFVYSPSGERIAVDTAKIGVPGDATMCGDRGVDFRAPKIEAGGRINVTSAHGNVSDHQMVTDMHFTRINKDTAIGKSMAATTSLAAGKGITITANNGVIEQQGARMKAGEDGIGFEAQKHIVKPSVEESVIIHVKNEGRTASATEVRSMVEKPATIETTGEVMLRGKDTTIRNGEIRARKVTNDIDGSIKLLPGRNYQTTHSKTVKYGWLFGEASSEYFERKSTVIATKIRAKDIELTGVGTADLQSVIIKEADMHVSKQLSETTAYNDISVRVVNRREGWFAPRLRGDPAGDAVRAMLQTTIPGDVLPNVANVVGAGAQTLSHITTLANLAAMPNPMLSVAQILLSRFTTGAVYSDITQKITRNERIPVQSNVELGVFTVANDKTHLEGIWNVDRASIDSGTFTTSAPKHSVSQSESVEGWSVSFSPAAILGALVLPVTASTVMAALPTVAVQSGERDGTSVKTMPMKLSASAIFIRCNDAVFSGSQISAKAVDAIVSGKLTVQSIGNLFSSHGKQSVVGVSLSALAGMVHDVSIDRSIMDHSLGAVPTIRIANREEVSKQVDKVADLVGSEKFFLKVGELLYNSGAEIGLRPDGTVTRSGEEKIEAGKVLNERIKEVHRQSESVINPAIGEIVAMIGQIDEFKRIRSRVKEAAIAQKLKPTEVDKVDMEVEKFLEQPDVKDSIEKLKVAEQRLEAAIQVLNEIEDENDPEIERFMALESKDLIPPDAPRYASLFPVLPQLGNPFNIADYPPPAPMASESGTRLPKWQQRLWSNFFTSANDYRKAHQNVCANLQNAEQLLSKIGVAMDAAQIVAGAGAGAAVGARAGSTSANLIGVAAGAAIGAAAGGTIAYGKVAATRYLFGKAIEKGEESFTNFAAQCAVGEEQRAEFEETARFVYSTAVLGASAAGMAKGALQGPKPGMPSATKVAKPSSIAVREVELAGTGMKLKIPLKEPLTQTEASLKQEKVPGQRDTTKVGASENLKAGKGSGGFQDNKDVHHVVPQRYLKKHGIPEEKGLSVVLPKEMHKETGTHSGKAKNFDLDQSFRDATAEGVKDLIKVEKEHGVYENPGRENLIKGLDEHKEAHPEWYKKDDKK